jgi:hypothetical protein
MEYIDDVSGEYQKIQEFREVLNELVDAGKVEMMGRVACGEPAYRMTATESLALRLWHRVRPYVGILPAFVAEHATAWTARLLERLCYVLIDWLVERAEPSKVTKGLADFALSVLHVAERIFEIANRLLLWRRQITRLNTEPIWLSIRY